MSLLLFPDEVIHEIVGLLTSARDFLLVEDLVENSHPPLLALTSPDNHPVLQHVVALSSTCVRLRILCGHVLFATVSLVRQSEIDAILAYSTRMDKWSDSKGLLRRFMKEILETGFRRCAREELARLSFRPSVNGDRHFWSNYQRNFSANNYVTELEITNETLRNDDLVMFPALASLKVLDKPLDAPVHLALSGGNFGCHLSTLAINLETLLGCEYLLQLLPQLAALDVICDTNSLVPGDSLARLKTAFGPRSNLSAFTFFVTDPDLLLYREFLDLFKHILATGPVETFTLRLTRKVGHRASAQTWELLDSPQRSGPEFINALNSSTSLSSVTIDFDLLSKLQFPVPFHIANHKSQPRSSMCFSLIDYSLSVPKLLFRPREIVANMIQALGATEVVFIYGEVIDQSHLHAIGVMSNLLVCLASDVRRPTPYFGVRKVSMEKAWSMSDDALVRHHYETLIDKFEAAEKGGARKKELAAKILHVSIRDHHDFASPRYRRREEYLVVTQDCGPGTVMPIMLPVLELLSRDHFWAAEASLRDLEHYCMREKSLSSIWD